MTKNHATNRRPNLSKLGLRELQTLFAEVLGESTRCPNRVFLERKIRARWAEEDATAAAAATEPVTDDRGAAGEGSDGAARAVETPEPPVAQPMPPAVEQPKRTRTARPGDGQRSPRGRFSSMTIEELQAKYLEVVGRPSDSVHRGYVELGNMGTRYPARRTFPRGTLLVTPHIHDAFSGRMALRFPRQEACMATSAGAWRSQGEPA